ncbi:MAG TPA: hypothetical protein VGX23_19935 [Actinocrinis sp.]|nr:hypothetical protein [Actinocrinis sp.]
MDHTYHPTALTWDEVDPGGHPFDSAAALDAVRLLVPASAVPIRPSSPDYQRITQWGHNEGPAWTGFLTRDPVRAQRLPRTGRCVPMPQRAGR